MHSVGVEAIISNLSKDINDTSISTGKRATAQKQLVTFLQNFQEAADNPNIQVDNGAMRAVKGFLDSEQGAGFRTEINYASRDPGRPSRDGRVPREIPVLPVVNEVGLTADARAELNRIKTEVADRIDPVTGTYSRAAPPAPAPAPPPTLPPPPAPAGEVRVEHGPEVAGPGTQFPGTRVYEPQERRARPPEPPTPTPPAA